MEYRFRDIDDLTFALSDFIQDIRKEYEDKITELEDKIEELEAEIEEME